MKYQNLPPEQQAKLKAFLKSSLIQVMLKETFEIGWDTCLKHVLTQADGGALLAMQSVMKQPIIRDDEWKTLQEGMLKTLGD